MALILTLKALGCFWSINYIICFLLWQEIDCALVSKISWICAYCHSPGNFSNCNLILTFSFIYSLALLTQQQSPAFDHEFHLSLAHWLCWSNLLSLTYHTASLSMTVQLYHLLSNSAPKPSHASLLSSILSIPFLMALVLNFSFLFSATFLEFAW